VTVSLVVPFRSGDPHRDRAWEYVRSRYQAEHPEWELVVDGGTDGPWSKGSAVDAAVARATGDIFVIADADLYVAAEALDRCVSAVADGAAWSQPHREVFRLSAETTASLYAGKFDPTPRPVRLPLAEQNGTIGPAGGGIVVCSRASFDLSGGIDPRFTEWGGEDISFARALDTLAGPCVRFRAPMIHLWHPPMPRRTGHRASRENELVAAAYLDASGIPAAMRRVVRDRSLTPLAPPKVSVAVMAHPRRAAMVEDLLASIGGHVEVAWDQENREWETGRRALLAYDPSAEWHVVVQDDAIVCGDFRASVAHLAARHTESEVIGLYLGAVRPYGAAVERAVTAAERAGASWVLSERLMWGVGTAFPVAALDALVHAADRARPAEYDFRLSVAMRVTGMTARYSLPSLVDHRQGPSILNHPDNARHARRFIGSDTSALDLVWSTMCVAVETPRPGRVTYPGRRAERPEVVRRVGRSVPTE